MSRAMPAALLIVDLQNALLRGAFQEDAVIENVRSLIASARASKALVVYVQHNHASFKPMMKGNPGWEIHSLLKPTPNDLRLEKEASDAFYGTSLEAELRDRGITRIVLCGMMTEYCIDTTARSALSHGFDVTLAGDAHTTGDSTLRAADIIAHHNAALPNVVHPTRSIGVLQSAEIVFV